MRREKNRFGKICKLILWHECIKQQFLDEVGFDVHKGLEARGAARATVKEVCARHNIGEQTYYEWIAQQSSSSSPDCVRA
jgi:hypothetical protein